MSGGHRAVIARLYAEVVAGGDLAALPALMQPDYVGRLADMPDPVVGREAFAGFVAAMHERMADVRAAVLDVVVEGDETAVRWLTAGRERAAGADAPLAYTLGVSFYGFRDGKLASGRSMRQPIPDPAFLGLPALPPTTSRRAGSGP